MMRSDDAAGSNPDATAQPAAGDWRLPIRRGLMLLVLLGCVLLGLTELPPTSTASAGAALSRLTLRLASTIARCCEDPRACLTSVAPPPAPTVTKTITLAIYHDIESLLDSYGPLLRADTPLLRPYHTEGQAANDAESWVLASTAGKVSTACERVLYHSHDCQPSLKDTCRRLMRNLMSAGERHEEVARSLAGPLTEGLWLSLVEASWLGLVWSLDNMDAVPRRHTVLGSDDAGPQRATTAVDGEADHDPRQTTAMLMRGYVNGQRNRQMSANGEIRRKLLSLREKCASIVADIRLISDPDASDGGCKWAELSPLAGQVEQLVSAVDDNLAALDVVDDALLRLGQWLDRMPHGYLDVDEVEGGTVVRTRFELPAPAVISRTVVARLERMRDDASALQQGWIAPRG